MEERKIKTIDEERITFLFFNKVSGVYLHQMSAESDEEADVLEESFDRTYFDIKRVKLVPSRDIWIGDKDTGYIDSINNRKAKINEYTLNAAAKNKIGHVYKQHKQVNIVRKALISLIKIMELEGRDEFKDLLEMTEILNGILENNNRYKESYRNHPSYDYEDKKTFMDGVSKALDGGLAQVVGRPQFKVEYDWDS